MNFRIRVFPSNFEFRIVFAEIQILSIEMRKTPTNRLTEFAKTVTIDSAGVVSAVSYRL